MSQKTNLNIDPYYDDFDPKDNFYRVLFKPGFPVQSRELTSLQSILQNQIESFGNHVFKDGSVVIPGNISYNSQYYAVKINPTHLGLSVGLYLQDLIGKRVLGQSSQLVAVVQNVITNLQSDTDDYTIYVKYINANSSFQSGQFVDGEALILQESLTYGNTTISSGDTFGTLISSEATSTASAVSISEGIYYIRGHFVAVSDDTLILDQYSNKPSYRVGLQVTESFIDAQDDNTLYDNARGFSNYAAPGADRLKISAILTKKRLTDVDDKNFIEVLRVSNGQVKKIQDSDEYSLIKDYFAKRTYEESGDYVVEPFNVDVDDSLNDRMNPSGTYYINQKTDQGNTPSEDLLAIKVSPGKAYVRGFDIEKPTTTILDLDKARDTKKIDNSSVPFQMGSLMQVDNVSGTPVVGINNNTKVYLNTLRKNSTTVGAGITVGTARVYAFNNESQAGINTTISGASDIWNLYLWDIQTNTALVLNANTTVAKDAYIKGLSSGASGYATAANTVKDFHVTQTSGSFIVGEQISINGSTELVRTIAQVTEFGIEDIRSVYQAAVETSLTRSFVADSHLQAKIGKGFNISDNVNISHTQGIATVSGKNWAGIKTDSIIKYTIPGHGIPTYNRIGGFSDDGLTASLHAVTGVDNYVNGALPVASQGSYNGSFEIATPSIKNDDQKQLYAELNSKNVSNVDLNGSTLSVVRQVAGKTSSSIGRISVSLADVGISTASFQPYSLGRYSVFYNDGIVENLTSDQVNLLDNTETLELTGLRPSKSNIRINTTVKKNTTQNKQKLYTRSVKKDVGFTATGISTSLSGLTANNFYGLRVEDEEISLNLPDVVKVIAIYESVGSGTVILDKLTFPSGFNLDTASILGEKITGASSGAVGQIVTRSSSTEVEFVYLNSNKFVPNESVRFSDSNINTTITSITIGQYTDKTQDYTLDKGQREQYYDYSRIVRKPGVSVPARRLKIIFDHYIVPANDAGDVYTVNSYDSERYKNDIPVLGENIRSSDTLDFRPRVSEFTSTTSSPFTFDSRDFAGSGSNPTYVVAPNESSTIGYSYYLPRLDKLVLNSDGTLNVVKGISADNPMPPSSIEDGMSLGTIKLPAYVYNPDSVKVSLKDNKRYTMKDIGKLEDRIENIEKLTALSLLELDTKSLQIQDSDGLTRYKSGFFVDKFANTNSIDVDNSDANVTINTQTEELSSDISSFSLKSQIAPIKTSDTATVDFSTDLSLLDSNVKKTGDLVTLNYSENVWDNLKQEFATKEQTVNPFGVANYNGDVKLTPSSDTWVRTINTQNGVILRTQSEWNNSYINNLNSSSSPFNKLREKNIEFRASGLQPGTNYYSFFGGNGNIDIIPKLLQVSMISGVFLAGETVSGYLNGKKVTSFRLADPNHKSGSYDTPTTFYTENPYSSSLIITTYSSSSAILNIDTYSLADDADGRFYGHTPTGMILVGESSIAQATVGTQSLTSDSVGDLIGSFYIRDPLANPQPPVIFNNGTKSFKITSSSTNSTATFGLSFTESTFYGTGIVDSSVYSESIVVRRPPTALPLNALRRDPLSQTFRTDNDGGFLTGVDLYFSAKDATEKLFVEVRETDLGGKPKDKLVQNFARAELSSAGITTSANGATATNVKFPSPLYLQPNKQYSLSLISPSSDEYKVWIAESNQATVATQSYPNAEQVVYSNQYTGGNLYKPQNGSIWYSSVNEDLKFKLYKANFSSSTGTAYFHNPVISIGSTYVTKDSNIPKLVNNPIRTLPRKLRVGIVTTYEQVVFVNGGKIYEGGATGAYGFIEATGGNINGNPEVKNTGIGYSNGTFANVPLYKITGQGSGATGTVTIANNKLSSVAIAETGSGYQVGDLLGITTSTVTRGKGATVAVVTVPNVDTLYLTNVKGQEFTAGQDLSYWNGSSVVALAGTEVRGTPTIPSALNNGNVFEVSQYNHGMQADNNIVDISGVFPNTVGEPLTAAVVSTNLSVSIANTSNFLKFEGADVSGSNPGYALINGEIIKYTSIETNALGGISGNRGIDNSIVRNHSVGDLVYKYELNGVSLTRINRNHNLSSNATISGARGIDNYHIEFARPSGKDSGDTMLNFDDDRVLGGTDARATQNYQFNEIIPQFNGITPINTNVSASLRTVSGQSAGGSEISFIDQGYEPVTLNEINKFTSPRLICSRVNETNRLTSLPRSRSLTLGITMETSNSNLSPVIDVSEAATFVCNRNRINNPVSNYVSDPRVNNVSGDPHSSVYISKKINLIQPASSLKVILSSYRHSSSDFRVLYKLFRSDSSEIDQTYQLFPGYTNLIDSDADGIGDTVVDTYLNDGSSDIFVRASNDDEFLDYQYTIDNLEQFNGFVIKIVMSGTNEAYSPRFHDLRAIALA